MAEERMTGKVAIVSGAARGQGASHAELLSREGASVVLGDILDAEGEAFASKLAGDGAEVEYVHLDVTSPDDWAGALKAATSKWGRVDALVNNAGIGSYPGAVDCSDEEWSRVIAVNQTGVFLGMRTVLPAMIEQKSGSIVNISSTFGLNGAEDAFAYQAAKGAVISMSKAAAVSYGTAGVRVNAICPGVVDTPMLKTDIEEMGAEGIDGLVEMQAIKRYGTPEDISKAVLYLVSEDSSFVTGAVLVVDGGYSAL
ncbi:MAG: glucose 1-dehydrogenase [Actinobacteria bacterium]|nr:glucose 1-dehydrogenase [Actinomycetota bacterium]